MPGGSGGGEAGPGLHEEGALEARATAAGLVAVDAGYLEFVEQYRDLATMARGYMAAAPFARAARAAGEAAVRESLEHALGPLQTSSGHCRLTDEIRYLIAQVPSSGSS